MRRNEGEAKRRHRACAVQRHIRLRGSLGMLSENRSPAHAQKGRCPQPTGGGKKERNHLRVTSGKAASCGEAVTPDRARRPPRAWSVTVTHRSSAPGQAPGPFPLTLGSRNPQPPLPP